MSAERQAETAQVCDLVGKCCWDGTEDGAACWNVGACGCKVVAHSPDIHRPISPVKPTSDRPGGDR